MQMARLVALGALLLTVACGGASTPTAPTSLPAPTAMPAPAPPVSSVVEIRGTITDTVTGAILGPLERTVPRLPARLEIAHPGYVTRSTWITTASPRIDLFPERGFDLRFYRQFARGALNGQPGQLWVLAQAPSFYMEVEGAKGLSRAVAGQLEIVARRLVPQLTGGRFSVTRWDTGPVPRAPQPGWIVIERRDEDATLCGRARLGAPEGHIWLAANPACNVVATFVHELGHAFGFFHVDRTGAVMRDTQGVDPGGMNDALLDIERHHAALAYARQPGNMDIDVDAPQRSTLMPYAVVD